MRSNIPECLNRRYKALDDLIKDLTEENMNCCTTNDPGIKLMCAFWEILKEDPNVDLTQAVQERMVMNKNSSVFGIQKYDCYMAGCCNKNEKKPEPKKHTCGKENAESSKSQNEGTSDTLPLNKVLCNLKDVASFEMKCQAKVKDLLQRQKQLREQIQILEDREKEGVQKLKEADCMWSCMEEGYRMKIAESIDRQKDLLKQLKEVEASNKKWRQNKKDLDFQMTNLTKCHQEIIETINIKTNDVKVIDTEIKNFKRHIECGKSDLESSKKSIGNKKQASDAKITKIQAEAAKLEKLLHEEHINKKKKEQEGTRYVKEAREDLQKLNKLLLQKRLENEDMEAKRESLILEVDLLKQSADQCKEKCHDKQQTIIKEIKDVDKEIADNNLKCIQCHECTDTVDIRKLCTDCPRCVSERDCLYENGECIHDLTLDCVCMSVKQKFLDNVFDNMYSVLLKNIKAGSGKAVADTVLNCLKKSRNGKVNGETKKVLQDFILNTLKRELKLTIVGGAIKTRCEMDPETYKQLMLCLQQVKVKKPQKTDQSTDAKKAPCQRWGGDSECNCPKGPDKCICTKRSLPVVKEPSTCPPEVKKDAGEVKACPFKESTACGEDCAMRVPSAVGREVAASRPEPCQEPTCQFKNMRAAQCVLGPESISVMTGPKMLSIQSSCNCQSSSTGTCVCSKDITSVPRERIIEEVMDAKHLKADSNKTCDKNTCTFTPDSKTQNKPMLKKETPSSVKENSTNVNSTQIDTNDGLNVKSSPDSKKIDRQESITYDDTIKLKNEEKDLEDRPCTKNKRLSCTSLTKLLLELSQQQEKPCKMNKLKNKEKLCKVRILGMEAKHEPVFALREMSSGNFKVLLDKEYERHHKKAIKNYELDESVDYAYVVKTPSGHLVIDLSETTKNVNNKALIVKSDSGSLQVMVDKKAEALESTIPSTSVIALSDIKDILNQIPPELYRDNSVYSTKLCTRYKSNSESNLQENVKLNIEHRKNLLIDSSIVLKKRRSGEYSVVLEKESKKTFINNIKQYLSSSKGHLPVKVTSSGVILIEVNTIKNNKKQNGLLKITPSGDIFVTLPNLVKPLSTDNVLERVNTCSCKSISTTCNGKSDSACDLKKCVCKNICFKSKKWYYENDVINTSATKCGLDMKNNVFECFNVFNYVDKELVNTEKGHNYDVSSESVDELYINELASKPLICDEKTSNHEVIYKDLTDNLETTTNVNINTNNNEVKNTENKLETPNNIEFDTKEDNFSCNWNAIDRLPPQLPQFLRDFTYVQ